MQSVSDIRTLFLNYFAKNGHEIVPASPLVPRNDPSLLFTNSGMVQFKNVFTGMEKRAIPRATTAQKSLRAGGKHNDLENVGYTARHHTFFEMLGNFSFGDYFKEQAITHAWTMVTKELALPQDRLLVTVYSEDDEAHGLWRRIAGLADDRIIRIPTSDNFWSMGDTGPCGPCSEIFYDHGDKIPGGPPGSADADGDRFIEIWNLVFMQYEQHAGGKRTNLPRPSIDTGMGLERVAAVLQGVHNNYEIDLFAALIAAAEDASGVKADGQFLASHRVIADHLRASAFLLAEGVLPSNEGRGYVLRRIMRRAMRHAHIMGCREPLLHKLVPRLVQLMGAAYPELGRGEAIISETLLLEESRFKQLLENGLRLLADETKSLKSGEVLSGKTAFTLYDTYGFPLDLTQDVLRGQNITVDNAAFDAEMQAQRQRARAAWAGSGDAATEQIWFDLKEQFGSTEFLGYTSERAEGKILALVKDGKVTPQAKTGDKIALIVNQTPFYAESGGQMGDSGVGRLAGGGSPTEGFTLAITDTQKKLGALWVHWAEITQGAVAVGQAIELEVNHGRRSQLRANHSATHLLHEALRRQVGDHIAQKGSLVAPDRLRFDVSHPKAFSPEELAAVEAQVNERVRGNSAVITRLMNRDEAIEHGAMALFGEKYGDEVRVVAMGNDAEPRYSVELCGGTHVARTGDIGFFTIIGEQAVSSGVRRIEAQTGIEAVATIQHKQNLLKQLTDLLRTAESQLPERVKSLSDEKRKLERDVIEARKGGGAAFGGTGASSDIKKYGDVNLVTRMMKNVPANELKGLVDQLKKEIGRGVAAVGSVDESGRVSLVIGVTDDLVSRVNAVELARQGATMLGGKGGGGRPDLAQAGGPDGGSLPGVMAWIGEQVGGG
ncbi:MAG: alanine--tRNA ligase [Candidatus Symbiobacter sp.]|nr:alanine--tRNA ligase [Candidatus Symbiobacter sp.]